jgi:hypothetical protein
VCSADALKTEFEPAKGFPLKVVSFTSSQDTKTGYGTWSIDIELMNPAAKTVTGFRVRCDQYDVFGTRVSHSFETTSTTRVKPQETRKFGWSSTSGSISAAKAVLEINKVAFEDGTFWEKKIDVMGVGSGAGEIDPSEYEGVKFEKLINDAFVTDFVNKKVKFRCKFINVCPNMGRYAALAYDSTFPRSLVFVRVAAQDASDYTVGYTMYDGLAIHKDKSDPLFELKPMENMQVYGTLKKHSYNNMPFNFLLIHGLDR